MPKRTRILGKKRGDRRSVPRWIGPVGEIVFYGALFTCGVTAFCYLLVVYLLPEWWANRNFVESTCQVVDVRVGGRRVKGERRYRPEILINYVTDGEVRGPTWTYDARFDFRFSQEEAGEIARQFEPSRHYVCWYDPINPANVVVVRNLSLWSWLLLIVPAAVVVFGGYRLVVTAVTASHSLERRAHIPPRILPVERSGARERGEASRHPAVPSFEDIANSPGTHLAYRLPSDGTPGWKMGGYLGMALFFGALLAVLASSAASSVRTPLGQVIEVLFMVALGVVQVGLIGLVVRLWLRQSRRGSTRLEIAAHPLLPGKSYPVVLVQTGRIDVRRLEMQLVCEEEATYSAGTDNRVAREVVWRDIILRRDHLEIRPEQACELSGVARIPAGGMHSFAAAHNRIDWYILIRLRAAAGGFERRFPVCVYPPTPAEARETFPEPRLPK